MNGFFQLSLQHWPWNHWNDETHLSASLLTRRHRSPRESSETERTDLSFQPVIRRLSRDGLHVNSIDTCQTGYNQKGVWTNSISRRKQREVQMSTEISFIRHIRGTDCSIDISRLKVSCQTVAKEDNGLAVTYTQVFAHMNLCQTKRSLMTSQGTSTLEPLFKLRSAQ